MTGEKGKIIRHKPRNAEIKDPDDSGHYYGEIEQYLEKTFGRRECFVYHEMVSDIVHIDIYVLCPCEKDNRYILFTSGMSDQPMTLPDELLPDYRHLELAELVMYLPGSWNVNSHEETDYWPIRLMTRMARFPHEYETWFGYGHSLPNGTGSQPYARNTKLCGAVLFECGETEKSIIASDASIINIYTIFPVYKREMNYKIKHNTELLQLKLQKAGITTTLDIKRKNVCSIF